jgi:hypothetical protein
MFPRPLGVVALAGGLQIANPTLSATADVMWGAIQGANDFMLGTTASNTFAASYVDGYSDWTVSVMWNTSAGEGDSS